MATFNFDVDIEEILYECSDREKRELAKKLIRDGYASKLTHSNAVETLFDEKVSGLIGNSWKLSKEDEETIIRIANKIVN